MFQKIFRILDMEQFNRYFPLPATQSVMKELEVYYKDMTLELVKRRKFTAEFLKLNGPIIQIDLKGKEVDELPKKRPAPSAPSSPVPEKKQKTLDEFLKL